MQVMIDCLLAWRYRVCALVFWGVGYRMMVTKELLVSKRDLLAWFLSIVVVVFIKSHQKFSGLAFSPPPPIGWCQRRLDYQPTKKYVDETLSRINR